MTLELLRDAPDELPDEGPQEHIGNARQLLASFVFLNSRQRAGDEGIELLLAAERRLKLAAAQLAANPSAAWNPYDLDGPKRTPA